MEKKYATFDQAKKLRELGFTLFNKETRQAAINNRDIENQYYSFYHDATNWGIESDDTFFDTRRVVTFMENIGTNSSKVNPLLASYGLLGDNKNLDGIECYLAPEQWEIVDWLLEKHGIWISIFRKRHSEGKHYGFIINQSNELETKLWEFPTPHEAYSAAFDYILENII